MTKNLAGRGEGLKELVAKHDPQLYSPSGPVSGVNGSYTIAFLGCSCGWNSTGEASKTEKWSEHVIAALEAAARLPSVARLHGQGQAPAGTAPREPKNARELAEKLCDCADRTLNGHARELANELREEILEVCRDWTRAALATPSPQAPSVTENVLQRIWDERDRTDDAAVAPWILVLVKKALGKEDY